VAFGVVLVAVVNLSLQEIDVEISQTRIKVAVSKLYGYLASGLLAGQRRPCSKGVATYLKGLLGSLFLLLL